MDWSLVLFVMKWIFLGLVYLFLTLLLVGVMREMRTRLSQAPQLPLIVYGRLRVIRPGSDPDLRPGTILVLYPDTHLGARLNNSIVLRDRYISGHHARLRWDGVSWWVEDLNSTNGTFINQRRLPAGTTELLPIGSTLALGEMSFEMLE